MRRVSPWRRRRAPEPSGLEFWAVRLASRDDLVLRRELMSTSEYFERTASLG